MPILQVEDVSVRFGGVAALAHVSLDVDGGEVRGLIGPNGSGKSTLLNAISGFVPLATGEVKLDGRSLRRLRTHQRAQRGLARTFQSATTFSEMDAEENVLVGRHRLDTTSFYRACIPIIHTRTYLKARQQALRLLERVGLGRRSGVRASELAYGEQRLLDLARAVASHGRVLLLDEPAAGLNDREVERLTDVVRALSRQGVSIVLIEHRLRLVMDLCDRITVLNFGSKISEGTANQVRADPAVIEAYLGTGHTT